MPCEESLAAEASALCTVVVLTGRIGISARIAHHGVGEFVDLDHLSVGNLLNLIRKVPTPSLRAT
jgi:hypothetical protein